MCRFKFKTNTQFLCETHINWDVFFLVSERWNAISIFLFVFFFVFLFSTFLRRPCLDKSLWFFSHKMVYWLFTQVLLAIEKRIRKHTIVLIQKQNKTKHSKKLLQRAREEHNSEKDMEYYQTNNSFTK